MVNKLFNFPNYFYSSLRCSKELFNNAWNSIPKYEKQNINMSAAIGMVCIKLSDDVFYKDFDKLQGVMDIGSNIKANEILMNVDDVFAGIVYEGYKKVIRDLKDKQVKVYSAEEVLTVLNKQFINKDSVSFDIFNVNKISIIIGYSHKSYIESRYKLIRDILSEYGWFMSMYDDVVEKYNKYDFPGYMELVFEPLQTPEATIDIRKDNKVIFHITLLEHIKSIKQTGLIASNDNNCVNYTENRIYFLKENVASDSFERTIETLCSQKSLKRNNAKMYCMVINVSKIPDNVKFYYDSHNSYGLFATGDIPFSAVEHIYSFRNDKSMQEIDIDKIETPSLFDRVYRLVKKVFSFN